MVGHVLFLEENRTSLAILDARDTLQQRSHAATAIVPTVIIRELLLHLGRLLSLSD